MTETFFKYIDMCIKVDRPIDISDKDADIGNRIYEILKGIQTQDNWTRKIDKLIKEHNIKYERVEKEEFVELFKKANNITFRH